MIPGLDLFSQFIFWKPERGAGGKVDKIPCDAAGRPTNPHDPAVWMGAEEARAGAAARGLGVGFVFTNADPFFFLDIDHAWAGSAWSPVAQDIFRRFAGCAMERSQSGAGAHIFGVGRPPENARKKNTAAGLELYFSGRFAALTGEGLTGNALTDAQGQVDRLAAEFFAAADPTGHARTPEDWDKGPDPEWCGPTDDAELVQRMTSSRSAAAIFGTGASAADLWTANAEALGRAYPTPDGRAYDASGADLALCLHLAFWTGRDATRMERLFGQSALVREKWAARADYRRATISKACAMTDRVLAKPGITIRAETEGSRTAGIAPEMREGLQILPLSAQFNLFRGCVYIRDAHRVYTPDGSLLKPEQFRAMFGGYTFVMDGQNDRTTRNAWEAFTENQGAWFPRAHNLCFRPEQPTGEIIREESRSLVNIYVPIETRAEPGDPAPFLEHLGRILPAPGDREILLAYMAALVQFPGKKFQWAPLLQGVEGNGKSLIIRCLAEAVGHRYTHLPNAADIHNKFNAWIEGKLFIGVEEIYTQDRQEALESLKPLITDDRVEVQGKGLDQRTGDNRANFVLCSNHKDAIRKTATDRRYCVFYTAQQAPGDLARAGLTGQYFPRLYAWLRAGGYAVVNHHLRSYPIPGALNPATEAHRAPETSSTTEALAVSLGGLEQEVLEAVGENLQGFRGGWISTAALGKLLDTRRPGVRRLNPVKRREMLAALGYIPHPGLPEGRSTVDIPAEFGRPVLYVKPGSPGEQIRGPEITRAYQIAQGYPVI